MYVWRHIVAAAAATPREYCILYACIIIKNIICICACASGWCQWTLTSNAVHCAWPILYQRGCKCNCTGSLFFWDTPRENVIRQGYAQWQQLKGCAAGPAKKRSREKGAIPGLLDIHLLLSSRPYCTRLVFFNFFFFFYINICAVNNYCAFIIMINKLRCYNFDDKISYPKYMTIHSVFEFYKIVGKFYYFKHDT